MKFFLDFLPILAFFVVYQTFDIFAATATAIAISLIQAAVTIIRGQKLEFAQIVTLVMISVLGGATLISQNAIFIKWKPTGVYWILAIVFFASQFIGKQTIIQRMLDKALELPAIVWKKLNVCWGLFFLVMGTLNLYIAYNFDLDTWVKFKLFGSLGLTFAFVLIQGIFISKYLPDAKANDSSK